MSRYEDALEPLPSSLTPNLSEYDSPMSPADASRTATSKQSNQSPSGTTNESITERYLSSQKDSSGSSSTIFTPNTPVIGSLVSGISSIKDQWTQQLTNWKTLVNGVADFETDPKMAYYVANAILRMVQGPMEPEPYDDDTDGVSLVVSALKTLGVDTLLKKIGLSNILTSGAQYLHRDYSDTSESSYTSLEGSNKPLSYVGDSKQGNLSGEIDHTETTEATSTYQFIKSLNGCPLFTIYEDGGFSSIFCGEGLDTDLANLETILKKREWEAPTYTTKSDPGTGGSEAAISRAIYNYSELVNPYDTTGDTSTGPIDNIKYALETLGALSGYNDFKGFAPRSDNNWSVRLYPYNPNQDYPFTRSESRKSSYYDDIFTPPLPITYIPTWKSTYKSGTYGAVCVMSEFDWEKTLPVISYDMTFGTIDTTTIQGMDSFSIPLRVGSLPAQISVSVLDDVDATFNKYLSKYFNSVIDNKRRAHAPIYLSSFVLELVIFKPALKVNYMFRFIVIPISYTNSLSLASGADQNSSVTVEFSVLGVLDYNDKAISPKSEAQSLDFDAQAYTWRETSPLPPIYWDSNDKNNDEIVS